MKSCLIFSAILLCLTAGGVFTEAHAQQTDPVTVRGMVSDSTTRLILYPATVRNLRTNGRVFTDNGGYYRLTARRGDSILISYIGYVPKTYVVQQTTGDEQHNILLNLQERFLPSVEVSGGKYTPYQLDSMARYEEYRPFLEKRNQSLVNTDKRTDGQFGITFSPFTRFSKKQKDLRKFKEYYAKNEIQSYIDYRYSKAFVNKVTGLTGDSLLKFMYTYQPPYEMLRTMTSETLIYWTAIRAKQWKTNPSVMLKPED